MKAMILAAGMGTRLRPLTDSRPKALVEIAGQTLLEIALSRLRSVGIRDVIINVHHFADMVMDYLKAHQDFGMHVAISREDTLLDTGGGLKKASAFFLDNSTDRNDPFILHNVDVISTIDLEHMLGVHRERRNLATLAVQQRETSRYLLFDEDDTLCGREFVREKKLEMVRPCKALRRRAFTGIHVISTKLLELMDEDGAFSIITTYLRLASQGERIGAFNADEDYWKDLGRAENIKQAEVELGRWRR